MVAGHDGGFPVPNFLQPLPTRESHHVTDATDECRGTDAKSAPKAPPARKLLELLPPDLDEDHGVLSRSIEEICARGLVEDAEEERARSSSGHGSGVNAAGSGSASAVVSTASSNKSSAGSATTVTGLMQDQLDEVLVPIEEWMETPDALKAYGSEKFFIGPL